MTLRANSDHLFPLTVQMFRNRVLLVDTTWFGQKMSVCTLSKYKYSSTSQTVWLNQTTPVSVATWCLRHMTWSSWHWDCWFESRLRHGCLCSSSHHHSLVTLSSTLYRLVTERVLCNKIPKEINQVTITVGHVKCGLFWTYCIVQKEIYLLKIRWLAKVASDCKSR
jgi:hypothetical protein